ncbi:MAG: hypothetical protein P8Q94_02745, partial [Candidatus Poseidoniaceae archaeon]|nr:hypothetical protein [Candidatus Poseidoniaceae archaeon]
MASIPTQGGIILSGGEIVESFVVPVHPHTVLAPQQNEGWSKLRAAYDDAAKIITNSGADLLIIYSTTWPSIIGHQMISDPNPEWVMVDHDFHDLGSINYSFNIDAEFAAQWNAENHSRGLKSRCVNYRGFPIDVGSVVALTLLNPDNKIPAVIVSSNVYADRSETTVLAKACRDLVKKTGRKAVAITAMSLSNRMFTEHIEAKDDKIHSLKDDEWNRKILEFLTEGRLEDVGQLSRTIQQQIRVQKVVNFKPMWWLSAMNENRNDLTGKVLAYEAIHGAGCAVVHLNPTPSGVGDKEYDEDEVEVFSGERGVLDNTVSSQEDTAPSPAGSGPELWDPTNAEGSVNTDAAPKPVGAYPHARRVGDLLYLSGVGPRQPGTN